MRFSGVDIMVVGTEFCVNGETFTVGSSWNSVGGATVNLAAGESFANGLFKLGDELTVGACGSSLESESDLSRWLEACADDSAFTLFGHACAAFAGNELPFNPGTRCDGLVQASLS